MRVTGVTANLPVTDVEAARRFYADYLGLSVEEMNLGWVARYRTEDGRASVQVVTRDETSPEDSVRPSTSATASRRRTPRPSVAATRSSTR